MNLLSQLRANLLTLLCTSILLTLVENPARSQEKAEASLSTVVGAWQSRQSSVGSIDFSADGERFGVLDDIDFADNEIPAGGNKPPSMARFPVQIRLVLDNSARGRLDFSGMTWSFEDGKLVPKTDICVFDGDASTVFFPSGTASLRYPNAYINKGDIGSAVNTIQALPLLLVYRPLDATLKPINSTKLVLTKDRGIVGKHTCLVLKYQTGSSSETAIWVDPVRDYVPVRYHEFERGILTHALEIVYSPDNETSPLPTSWKDVWTTPKGEIIRSTTASVREYKVNSPVTDEVFKLHFPPGTWVHNDITKERYIVRENDGKRPILPGEYNGENYEQLLHSDPPKRMTKGWFVILIGANIILLLGIIVLVRYRRLRQRSQATAPDRRTGAGA